ncbi:MAG: hypothetical protein MK132_20450 [Lentisphaerales bacterium]|nr:hypothetical protein [Lentisphaerales bacterium]
MYDGNDLYGMRLKVYGIWMKGLRVVLIFLFTVTPVLYSTADLVDNIAPYLIDPSAKDKDKKRGEQERERGTSKDKKVSNEGKTRVTETNKYTKDLNDVKYLAFYYSNKQASKTYKKAEGQLTKFYSKLAKKNKKSDRPPEMEVIFMNREVNEKDMATYKFPHMDFFEAKKNISANKFAGRSLPCLVVVLRQSEGIVFGGHIATVVDKLEKLIDFDDEVATEENE